MAVTLGIDLGTSSCKAVLYNSEGRILDYQAAAYPTDYPQAGWVEQDPRQWLCALRSVCYRLANNPAWSQVEALGISGQMHTLTLLDSEGEPLLPAINWQDTRAAEILARLGDRLEESILGVTHNSPNTIMTLLPLLWIKENRPDLLEASRQMLLPKDYLRFKLTGRVATAMATDPSDASGTLLYDVAARNWSETLIRSLELPRGIFPEILPSLEICGAVSRSEGETWGIPEGLPIIVGAGDLASEAFSTGISSPGAAIIRFGTAGAVMAFSTSPRPGPFHCYATVNESMWMLVAGTQSCGAALDWGRNSLFDKLPYSEIFLRASGVSPGAGGLLFIPHLSGERAPYFDPKLRAHFVGLGLGHHRDHIIRALLEGIVFSLRDAFMVLPEADRVESFKFIGGQGEQRFLGQLLADVFDRPVQWLPQAGPAVGAAMMATQALGYDPGLEETAVDFVPDSRSSRVYDQAFDRYQKAIKALLTLNSHGLDEC